MMLWYGILITKNHKTMTENPPFNPKITRSLFKNPQLNLNIRQCTGSQRAHALVPGTCLEEKKNYVPQEPFWVLLSFLLKGTDIRAQVIWLVPLFVSPCSLSDQLATAAPDCTRGFSISVRPLALRQSFSNYCWFILYYSVLSYIPILYLVN